MNVLDLFSGIGGFSLGLERAGLRTVAFCEIDPYCRRVLRRHWPDVPVYDDVRTLTGAKILADADAERCGWRKDNQGQASSKRNGNTPSGIDVICGGFPCQDISVAGKGAGITGERSGLWSEYARIIGEVRPRYVIVENVAALLHRGLADVLGDLAAIGYDAEWHCIPASAVGAPHRRDRIWIIADDQGGGRRARRQGRFADGGARQPEPVGTFQDMADANGARCVKQRWGIAIRTQLAAAECADWWRTEPDVGRVAHGVPNRVDRLRALGNAVVPQIPEIIGRAIMSEGRHEQ